MSDDKIAKLHLVVQDPLRQKILLQLANKKMTFNDILGNLEIQMRQDLEWQLSFLEAVMIEGEHLVTKQSNSAYQLTDKGRYLLDKMITFPQLTSKSYTNLFDNKIKAKPKWITPYFVIMVVATIAICATLPFTLNIPWDSAILILILALVAEDISHYVRFFSSLSVNRGTYILIGIPIGFVIWLNYTAFSMFTGAWANQDIVFIFSTLIACLGIGALIGDLIGKLRKYKGPERYQI